MSRERTKGTCAGCGGAIRKSRFDLAVGGPAPCDERLFFGIAGAFCPQCGSVAFDRDTRIVLGLDEGLPLAAIESDAVLSPDIARPSE
jgi:hypothetical protein